MQDWAEIRRLHRAERILVKTIARTWGVSRNTVRAAIASDGPPKYERATAGSAVDAFEDAIRLLRCQREEATCELEVRTMPDLDENGVHLYYEDVGSGLPLLLSHSWFCNGEQWPQVPDLVAAGYRVLNLDNRGHGRSGPLLEPYSLWEMSADLIAVLDHAGVDSAVLVGLSVGGFCSIRTALQHPDRVRGLVLADADAGSAALSGKVKAALLTPVARRRWGRPIAINAVVDVLFGQTTRQEQPDLVEEWRQTFLEQDVDSMLTMLRSVLTRDDVSYRLPEIVVPTLVIVGEEDVDPGVLASARIAARVPGARFEVLPAAGHLSAIEQPGAFAARLLDFLNTRFPAR